MEQCSHKTVLFLCTGNYYRSRFAEALFNGMAARIGLAWTASSRGLALERGFGNIGPMAVAAIDALRGLGVCVGAECARLPLAASSHDFDQADRIVALKRAEHLPLVQARFAPWSARIEYWHVDDAPTALGEIERQVRTLVAAMFAGADGNTMSGSDFSEGNVL